MDVENQLLGNLCMLKTATKPKTATMYHMHIFDAFTCICMWYILVVVLGSVMVLSVET